MIDAAIGAQIDIAERAAKAKPRPHIGVIPLGEVDDTADISRRRKRLGAVERHDERHRGDVEDEVALGGHRGRHHQDRQRGGTESEAEVEGDGRGEAAGGERARRNDVASAPQKLLCPLHALSFDKPTPGRAQCQP